jgi:hypothetical protein
VKNLYLSKEFAPGIAAALQELVGARITEVLPSLQNIFVEGLEPLGPFPGKHWAVRCRATAFRSPCPPFLSGTSLSRTRERTKRKSALSCMHSTLAFIRREADIVVCAQRRNCGRDWRGFLGSTQAWHCRRVWSFLSFGPQASPQRQEERRGPKRRVDLNQHVCLNDWLAIYSTVMMSVVHLRFCSIMALWCRRLTA